MRRSPALAVMLLLGCAAAVPAFAGGGGIAGDWEIGLYGGPASPDSYDSLDPDGGLLYGFRAGYYFTDRWSLEGSYQTFSTDGSAGGQDVDVDLDALRFNMLFNFRPGKKFRWFLTAGLGSEMVDYADVSESDLGWNAGGGARWLFGKKRHFGLRADARWVSVKAGGDIDQSQSSYEATGGLLWAFGGGPPKDTDGDRVKDSKDGCAATPRGALVDATGCPKDTDGDRVYDGIDKCISTPTGWKVDLTGCPADADADGVTDEMDRCPATPKEAKADANGCPVDDADADGVWDGGDRCPGTPKGVKVDPVGCPMDADGDGVFDGEDKCPGSPKGAPVDATGCPAA